MYKEGVAYAVTTLAASHPDAALYIDAGHGGWLGFEKNAAAFATLIIEMGVLEHIRGFSTNVCAYMRMCTHCRAPQSTLRARTARALSQHHQHTSTPTLLLVRVPRMTLSRPAAHLPHISYPGGQLPTIGRLAVSNVPGRGVCGDRHPL